MASFKPAVNERILCYHGPVIYEAKVLKTESFDESNTPTGELGAHYFVHYKGWKNTWDEWVPQLRILEWNDLNLAKQRETIAAAKAAEKSGKITSKTSTSSSVPNVPQAGSSKAGGVSGSGMTRGTKRKHQEDESSKKPDLKLVIPDGIKAIMVDDWEMITKNRTLLPLPRSPTVTELLKEFGAYSLKSNLPQPTELTQTLISGLQAYFDRALGPQLLYRFERAQYADIRKRFITGQKVNVAEQKTMSDIYGAEHLCRLIVNLPKMVAATSMDGTSVELLRQYVTELMNWMLQNRQSLFVGTAGYENPGQHYTNLAI